MKSPLPYTCSFVSTSAPLILVSAARETRGDSLRQTNAGDPCLDSAAHLIGANVGHAPVMGYRSTEPNHSHAGHAPVTGYRSIETDPCPSSSLVQSYNHASNDASSHYPKDFPRNPDASSAIKTTSSHYDDASSANRSCASSFCLSVASTSAANLPDLLRVGDGRDSLLPETNLPGKNLPRRSIPFVLPFIRRFSASLTSGGGGRGGGRISGNGDGSRGRGGERSGDEGDGGVDVDIDTDEEIRNIEKAARDREREREKNCSQGRLSPSRNQPRPR